MCKTPKHAQQTVIFKTFNPLLPAVLLICLIPLGSAQCPPEQFFHFNLATYKGVCCFTVPLPAGYGFKSCEVNGTQDSIEKCPEGLYQPDNTRTESEATCSKEFECNPEEHLKIPGCESGQNCGSTCICNYKKGYCGEHFYDCKKFPKDCPSELVQKDCSCKRDPPQVTSLSPENGSNILTNTTTPSTAPRDGGTHNKPGGGVDTNNGTAITNGSGNVPDTNNGTANTNVPDQTQSTVLNAAVIAIGIFFAVGLVAVVILAYIFRRRLKKWLSKYRNFCCLNRSTSFEQVIFVKSNQDGQGKEAEPFLTEVRSEGGYDDQKNVTASQSEDNTMQDGVTDIQSLVLDNAGSDGCYGDKKNPAGDHGEGDSIQTGGSIVQSLVVDHGKTGSQGIDTAGPFCSCCGRHWKRCNKLVIEQSLARVKPQQGVNENPLTLNMENEMSIDGYSSFTPSIYQDHESHDNTNAADEETTLLKPVNSQVDQTSSTVQQISEVEGTRTEESLQAELGINEHHMTIGMPIGDRYRTDSHSGVMNQDEEDLTVENEEDVEEV
ncbi:hypothetical protein CHS0354_016839 [Potamilus streckersoni]|uniref:Uncharacterized protein n=1 Tax=Potamilus streckersoni TaxID=2493646 RepID=A0AAE0SVW1_9BIVA|nr:hypothetical protein CHS0354_016839 [Potamilus streckersoni]